MTRMVVLLAFMTNFSVVSAQTWSSAQLEKANTAKNSTHLTPVEKETILYINLCRLYPKDFLTYEVMDYYGSEKYSNYLKNSTYRASLIKLLGAMQPVPALYFDLDTYTGANCFAKEQGQAGTIGHDRKKCKVDYAAECCAYGDETGKDIALSLLIDHDVPSLGHRKICLDKAYTKIGVSVQPHKKWDVVAVLNFNR